LPPSINGFSDECFEQLFLLDNDDEDNDVEDKEEEELDNSDVDKHVAFYSYKLPSYLVLQENCPVSFSTLDRLSAFKHRVKELETKNIQQRMKLEEQQSQIEDLTEKLHKSLA